MSVKPKIYTDNLTVTEVYGKFLQQRTTSIKYLCKNLKTMFGLFNSKGGKKETTEAQIPWNRLTSIEQLNTIEEESKSMPVAIFKHSTRCGISRMVLRNFESSYDVDASQMKLYYLDLLAHREVSDEVGYRFQVIHQSPQLIVIKNGSAVSHASHHSIQASDLERFV